MDRPVYLRDPIQSVRSLACAISCPEQMLRSVSRRAGRLYIGPKPKPKKSGGIRYVFDTKPPLKDILKRINHVIFQQVHYPEYLTGSLKGRDFVANVEIHKGAKIAITEDIAQFFDNISSDQVYGVWRNFFHFHADVADLLTCLTTKDGRVFQGTPTSSYLANLVFWDREPGVVARLAERGFRYSRYVDDITISSEIDVSVDDKRWAISQIYGMIGGIGFKPQRVKHQELNARRPITIMRLNVNSNAKPTLTKQERSSIRAQVHQLEKCHASGNLGPNFQSELNKVAGRVARLKRLHRHEAEQLQNRIKLIRGANG